MALFSRQICRISRLNWTRPSSLIYYAAHRQLHASGSLCHYYSIKMDVQNYQRIRDDLERKIGGLKDAFRLKIEQYMDSSESNTIFRQDLYAMTHLAKSDEDLQTLRKMIIRQNKYPISYHFGPVICRLLYFLNKPDVAVQMYKDPETAAIFSDAASPITIMDLVYECEMYEQCMEIFHIARDRRGNVEFINRNAATLFAAACSRLGTEDSLNQFLQLMKEMRDADFFYTNRTMAYGAHLALKLGHPDIAADILNEELRPAADRVRPKSAHTGMQKNLQLACYASLGELKKALDIMRTFAVKTDYSRPEMIFPEMIQYLEDAVRKSEDTMFQERFDDVMKILKRSDCISTIPLDDYMYRPIYPNQTLKAQNIRMQHKAGRKIHGGYQREKKGDHEQLDILK